MNDISRPPAFRASPWPEADAIFRSDFRWLGSDAAYTIPLGGERVLWLFGDTFVIKQPGQTRRDATFVHNTIGIQDGLDPSTAKMTFHWRGTDENPTPFFPCEPGAWYWPMDGTRVGEHLVIFFMKTRSARPDLGTVLESWKAQGSLMFFETFDIAAALVENPDDDPASWRVRMLATPPIVDRIIPGAGVVEHDGYLYAYGWRDGHELRAGRIRRRPRYRGFWTPRRAFVLRWKSESVVNGLSEPQWWCGDAWKSDPTAAVPVVRDPGTEFTVDFDEGKFVLVEASGWVKGIDASTTLRKIRGITRFPMIGRIFGLLGLVEPIIAVRYGQAPQGPWSDPVRTYSPKVRKDVLIYAGKGHPELKGADLVCTYGSIALTADRTLDDMSLYFPKFVRLDV